MLTRANLNIAALVSKEESRFTLNGILVTPDCTVETDGHQLVKVTTPDKFDTKSLPDIPGLKHANRSFAPFILRAADALAIAKTIPKKSTIPVLTHAFIGKPVTSKPVQVEGETAPDLSPKTTVPVGTTDLDSPKVVQVTPLSGNFPDYNRVMPKREDTDFCVTFDCNLLVPVLQQIIDLHKGAGDRSAHADFRFQRPEKSSFSGLWDMKAVRIDSHIENQELTAVVMPCRGNNDVWRDAPQGPPMDLYRRSAEALGIEWPAFLKFLEEKGFIEVAEDPARPEGPSEPKGEED
jgi:hypothetical protein